MIKKALLHKPDPTVPLYADGFGLFVFAAPLTSVSLSKNQFFDRLGRPQVAPASTPYNTVALAGSE